MNELERSQRDEDREWLRTKRKHFEEFVRSFGFTAHEARRIRRAAEKQGDAFEDWSDDYTESDCRGWLDLWYVPLKAYDE